MKTLQELTGEDFENCIDDISIDFVIAMPIAMFVDATQNLALDDFNNFISNYVQFVLSKSNGTLEQATIFANTVYENINNRLL